MHIPSSADKSSVYPLKFKSRFVEKIWGGRKIESALGKPLPPGKQIGESWEIYDFPPGVVEKSRDWVSSEITNGPLAGRSLHWAVRELGPDLYGPVSLVGPHGQFPILIKFLDAREDLSVQVHPDLAYANANPGAHLKTEAWYVLQSDPGSRLLQGLRAGTDRGTFEDAIGKGDVERLINPISAVPGDCFYLPSGTVHALGAGILVAEVQTPSDTTFRVFDFNRVDPSTGVRRELHVKQALACIDFSDRAAQPPAVESPAQLVDSPFFRLHRRTLSTPAVHKLEPGRPRVLIVVAGDLVAGSNGTPVPATFGEIVLIPAAARNPFVQTSAATVWLEVEFPR